MYWSLSLIVTTLCFIERSAAYNYDPSWTEYNLNTNQQAKNPLEYSGQWDGHQYTASPKNWRIPFYSLFLDRFVNGDPTNDDINGTSFEYDPTSNQMRNGGDLQGLINTLDYLQGMGIKVLYIAGSPFLNQPWTYDSYSPLDLTILDWHFGDIAKWREAVNAIHQRGMYVVLDNTFATLGDLLGFEGYLNVSAPFTLNEHKVEWKNARRYWDFDVTDDYNTSCLYPNFWLETGYPVGTDVTDQMKGCYAGDFDQYGDTEAFGVYPDWRRQLTKFASVQDRLREWHEPVRQKLENFYCILIGQLDIDGYRYDKAMQSTVDAMGYMSAAMRTCAKKYGKENFFLPGEITGGNVEGSIFLGRGRQPNMIPENLTLAVSLTNASDERYFLRDAGLQGLDAAAFHYTTYRTLTRFLGMDGNLEAGYDSPKNWVDQWNDFLLTNDLVNANTGEFDPRHMYGVTNQDVFRWGAIRQGIQRQLLGHFITTILMPGVPLLLWGEEQGFYLLDSTATNYIFGRQPMSSALAWQSHGCYSFSDPSTQYYDWPIEAAREGCRDDAQMYDHRDPTHPVRNILRHMYHLREVYPTLNDGMFLQQLSNQTEFTTLPGSSDVPTEFGLWSVLRSEFSAVQNLSDAGGQGATDVWLLYSNKNETTDYVFNCANNATNLNTTALLAPYSSDAVVKSLFYPFEEISLQGSVKKLGINGSNDFNGCAATLSMPAFGWKAYVLKENWVGPKPMLTTFVPGHDARIISTVQANSSENLDVELQFSQDMDCDSVTSSITFESTTITGELPSILNSSVRCTSINASQNSLYVGYIPSAWSWKATLTGVRNGVHALIVSSPNTTNGKTTTGAVERLLFRIGQSNNPVIFPHAANYSSSLLTSDGKDLVVHHEAAGASLWRYSTNWGTTFSNWKPYDGNSTVIERQSWSGTKLQEWEGDHVKVEYFSPLVGQSDIVQQGDANNTRSRRRFPHLFWNGPYNQYGYDIGLDNVMAHSDDDTWEYYFLSEWISSGVLAQMNVWGINPDGRPDQSFVYGDIDQDSVLDRLLPSSLSGVSINITQSPPKAYLGWKVVLDDATMIFRLEPYGRNLNQLMLFALLAIIPLVTAALSVWFYMQSFYSIKFNEIGIAGKVSPISAAIHDLFSKRYHSLGSDSELPASNLQNNPVVETSREKSSPPIQSTGNTVQSNQRRTVLIATMEYDIEDWAIKIKIGGLGVMAQLMGKNLEHQNLIWVVPCVGGVEYPSDTPAPPMTVQIMGKLYNVDVQYHVLRNITYVLLDAPVFRQQTKTEPYPARMDDMPSAVYYSAWNQCIAQTVCRFPIDLYHINDYHGTIAPLYLLPQVIPVCLSLHNAEFQGLWPMRTMQERDEVCSVFNLPLSTVRRYVQFGEVFNLLHAGASILREHQQGFGAVGVSNKYGKRSYARYPIFWGLNKIGALPNPDPSDTAVWDKKLPKDSEAQIDPDLETSRRDLRKQAQNWAGLHEDENAELFVFVGRWSMQKGIDLIADVFPSVLEANPSVQLITIGPVIDLYGKFAAAKLAKMMELYPGRVCSKPVFTALPPFVFSGAEFALIPSRDEPFGLVAVEFGRKGALGVGARVGGLGQMPGWWYTVESNSTSHLTQQFKTAINQALTSSTKTRALMRARSAKQRFPVAQWVEDLEILQSTSIRLHEKMQRAHKTLPASEKVGLGIDVPVDVESQNKQRTTEDVLTLTTKSESAPSLHVVNDGFPQLHPIQTHSNSEENVECSLTRKATLGLRKGPGHVRPEDQEQSLNTFYFPFQHNDAESDALERLFDDVDGANRTFPARYGVEQSISSHVVDSTPYLSPSDVYSNEKDTPLSSRRPSADGRGTLDASDLLAPPPLARLTDRDGLRNTSMLSLHSVMGDKKDYNLQKVDPFFTDSTGEFLRDFEHRLESLNATNSSKTCIEEYLVKSEKKWFDMFRDAKLGRSPALYKPNHTADESRATTRNGSCAPSFHDFDGMDAPMNCDRDGVDEFLLGEDYVPPTGLRKIMQQRVLGWPVYSFLLAFGQIIAANSYQITLLTGEVGQSASKLYVVVSIYLVTSIGWWVLFRRLPSRWCLSLPFLFYGLAFFFIALAHFGYGNARGWVQNIGTAWYACASSSGSIFFALNFGDEGGAQMKTWVFRACIVQGTQQLYVVALWAWGAYLSKRNLQGLLASEPVSSSWKIMAICLPIACLLWAVGLVNWFGLPKYYRQHPGTIPSFYRGITRRKLISWFLLTVVIQNFFLSAPYGRNWAFLFSSAAVPTWQIVLLSLLFFVLIWSGLLAIFARLTKSHSWILPLFAIGLGAPRWAQIWWGTSNIGLYLPWAPGGAVSSAMLSRSLWLWLGTLDTIQGVGIGMILLVTLTRIHVAFTLLAAQVLGSLATILARACAPNNVGPGPISPDISKGFDGVFTAWFWIGLLCNLGVCVGFFVFFRKEQLSKP